MYGALQETASLLPPPDGSTEESVTITPNGNAGKVTVTATIASKVDGDGNNVVEGLETLGPLSASYELTVLEDPVVTLSSVGTIMLGDGNLPIPVDLSASIDLDPHTPDEWIPAPGNLLSSFVWEFVSGGSSAEFVPGTENVSDTGAGVKINAKSAGTVTVRGKLTLPGKVVTAETTFSIIAYDPAQVPHQTITIVDKFSEIIATDTKTVKLNFTPSDALLSSIVWEYDSGKFTVTPVSKDEIKITAKPGVSSPAIYTIRAKSNVTGANAKDDFTVNLKPLDVTVAVTGNVTEISKGGAATYTASTNATNQNVTWSVTPVTSGVSISSGGVLSNTESVSSEVTITVKATSTADTNRSGTKTIKVKPPVFTVKYDANGGAGTMADQTGKVYGQSFQLTNNAYSKTGYSFSGWSKTSNGTVDYANQATVNNINPSANNAIVTLYAVWAIANYSITYNNMDGATNHASNPAVYTYETNTITLQAPTKAGYTFGGWFDNQNLSGTAVTQIVKGSTGNKTLYAKWTATTATLNYSSNGGSGTAPTAVTAAVGTSVTLAAGTGLTKSGYYFSGWNTAVDGGGTTYAAGASYTLNATVTLYAKWDAGFALIYDVNGGTGTPPAKVASQTAISVTLAAGTGLGKQYCIFGGWNTQSDGGGTTYAAGASYALSANVTLYAKWDRSPDLMVKFGIKTDGYDLTTITTTNVTNTFNAVSAYIKTQSAVRDMVPSGELGVIKVGDYVELPFLNLSAYNGNDSVANYTSNPNNGTLQLMVVAINPYYNKNGNGTSTPHLIFYFKEAPVGGRMEATATNQNGYAGSEMRKYLTPLDGVSGSGNFWTGLKNSGVPESVVWKISRRVANKGGGAATTLDTIEDYLWLPTEREIWGDNIRSDPIEDWNNQAGFEYYGNIDPRKANHYWLASPAVGNNDSFVEVHSTFGFTGYWANKQIGVGPAFAVK
ncbi:MAG: hypothetical protein Pg6A_10220 [Termitinemataceae bacterium]|nr:MAG: hypothetical protein Pg6A_10220 [Termitinemataceae bacterium]